MTNAQKLQSQRAKVLNRLQSGRSITPRQADNWWGCMRLAARINELRDNGVDILTDMIKRNGKSYAQYRMVK